jgi:putative transposase
MVLTFKYRLLPDRRQHRALEHILEQQRQLFNAALEERTDAYRKFGVNRNYFDQCKALTEWRREDIEASSFPANLQRWTLKRVDLAYNASFRRIRRGEKAGFPRFRGPGRFITFGFQEFCGVHISRGSMRFKGMPGGLRIHMHRPLPDARIRSCFLRRELKGWSVGFAVHVSEQPPTRGHRAVGVDLGIGTFVALSDGGFIPSPGAAKRAERSLGKAQRAKDRKVKGSNGRKKALKQLARRHAAVARARLNHLHQASARLVRDYDLIAIERLNVKGLARSALAKQVHDVSWAKFVSMLRYKAECAGRRLVEVDPHGTTQDCSGCGERVPKGLGDRVHACPHCSLSVDRDLNAARNVLNRARVGPGLRNGCNRRAGGNLS